MKRKKVIGITALSLLAASMLFGCGKKEKSGSTSKNSNEVVTWVNCSDETPEGKAWNEIATNFNKENEGKYKVKIEYIPRSGSGGGYEDKVNAALTTNSLPDVITLDGPNTAAYASSKIIAPLDEYVTDEADKEDILDSIIQQGTYEGKLYAIGISESGVGIYYNKAMFKDAGIDLETLPTIENPWDWNQFMEVCEKIKVTYKEPAIDMCLSSKDEMLMYAFDPFIWSQGGNIVSEDGKKAVGIFDSEENAKVMTFLQTMISKEYTTNTPVKQGFQQGKYAMLMSGSWTMAELATGFPDIEYGILPYPVSPDTKKLVSPTGSWQLAMTATTSKKEASAEFIKFATNTESSEIMSLGNAVLPIRKSTAKNIESKISEPMKMLMQQNQESGHPRPVVVAYPQVSRAFQNTILDISYVKENPDVKKVLETRAQEMQTAMDKQK